MPRTSITANDLETWVSSRPPTAAAELALDAVPIGRHGLEAIGSQGHG